jgi:hypothetical protein
MADEKRNEKETPPPETEIEGGSVIIRGQGPLISEGVYGQGPILEAITPEEHVRRKAEAKKAEEDAKAEARKAEPPKVEPHKVEVHKAEVHKAEEHKK